MSFCVDRWFTMVVDVRSVPRIDVRISNQGAVEIVAHSTNTAIQNEGRTGVANTPSLEAALNGAIRLEDRSTHVAARFDVAVGKGTDWTWWTLFWNRPVRNVTAVPSWSSIEDVVGSKETFSTSATTLFGRRIELSNHVAHVAVGGGHAVGKHRSLGMGLPDEKDGKEKDE